MIKDYVEIIENKSSLDVDEMVKICKRKNNRNRDFVFVNQYQGKHIPQSPHNITMLFNELLLEISKSIDSKEKVLIIGFAETATAIGQYIANNLSNCSYYLQTTREKINVDKDRYEVILFEEEHSHATNQILYLDKKLPTIDRILFIDDEITTGNTIINAILKINELISNCKYSVASFLNWQDSINLNQFKKHKVNNIYLVKGKIKENFIVDIKDISKKQENIKNIECSLYNLKNKYKNLSLCNNERLGYSNMDFANINKKIDILYNIANQSLNKDTKNILVIGTEEFMYIPLQVALKLENDNKNVKFHATTRSPIVANNIDCNYAITETYEMPSPYDGSKDRKTFLYNLPIVDKDNIDEIFIITDGNYNEMSLMLKFKEIYKDSNVSKITILKA